MDEEDPHAERKISDLEVYKLYVAEWAHWNVYFGYAGIPPDFKSVAISKRISEAPVPENELYEFITVEDIDEVVSSQIIERDKEYYTTQYKTEETVFILSQRIDFGNKMKLVDKGVAHMSWDAEKGEPIFFMIGDEGSSTSSVNDAEL